MEAQVAWVTKEDVEKLRSDIRVMHIWLRVGLVVLVFVPDEGKLYVLNMLRLLLRLVF